MTIPRGVSAEFCDLLRTLDRICKVWFVRETPNMESTHDDHLHYHRRGRTAALDHHQLERVRGSKVFSRKMCYRSFNEFDSLKELPRSGVPVIHYRARILRGLQENPKNGMGKWSVETGASGETFCRAFYEKDKSPKRP